MLVIYANILIMEKRSTLQIVPTNENYSYNILKQNIEELRTKYPFLEVGNIGYSTLGKPIYYIRIGSSKKQILYHASIHANEWITSVLLMKFVEEFCKSYTLKENIYGYSAQELFNTVSLYIVPMVNPDGVDLVTNQINKNSAIYRNYLSIARNYPNIPFPSGWKANFNGVDLNLQFPAEWEEAKKIKFSQGFTKPSPRDYVGEGPLTERESLALYQFTLKYDFALTISYHTQGREIYWQFQNYATNKAKQIGEEFARQSGYTLAQVPYNSSFAGYKDWFLQTYQRPAYTVEAGIRRKPTANYTI